MANYQFCSKIAKENIFLAKNIYFKIKIFKKEKQVVFPKFDTLSVFEVLGLA